MSFFRNHILFRKKRFRPDSIPNLGFWLESDYGITKDGSNAVSEWVDRSPNGYTLSQATGANQPIWTANEFGSQAGLIFDGTNDSLQRTVSNPFSTTQNFTYFAVLKTRNNNSIESLFSLDDAPTNSNSFFITKRANTENNSLSTNSLLAGTTNFVYGDVALNNNNPHLCISESNGTTWTQRIDRVDNVLTINGTNNGNAPGDFSTLDNINLGLFNRLTQTFIYSNFAAVLFYERQLSAAERTRAENYLISKYGIAA